MRIPNVDNDAKPGVNLALAPKLIDIIEKMALKPSLIEKLLLTSQNTLLIDLIPIKSGQKLDITQLNLPMSVTKDLIFVSQSQIPIKLSLNIKNNQVVLELVENQTNSPPPVKLVFKKVIKLFK